MDAQHRAFVQYARTVLNHSLATVHWYEHTYRRYRQFLLAGVTLDPRRFELRITALDEWVADLRRDGVAPVTVNSYWRAMRAFFTDWERREGIDNPFRFHRTPKAGAMLPKALSFEQCQRILDATYNYPWRSKFERERAMALIATMLYAGLRRGEVLRLRFTDVDLEGGTMRVCKGKGPHGGKDRMAYIAPELRAILQNYLRERHRLRRVNPEFFSSTRAEGGVTVSTLSFLVGRIRRAACVRFSAHMLRHSFVTHLLRAGAPIQVVQDLAGHASIVTTMNYTRVWDEDRRTQIQKMRFL